MCIRLLENNQSCHIESEGERKLILNKPHQTKLFKDWKHLSDVSDLPMGQQQRLSYSVVMDDCMKRPQETMPCQMDAKQSLVRINNTHTFAIKYDLIPLGKVSTRRKRMRHTESVYTVQPTPLYTHSQTGKRHFHFKRSMLTLRHLALNGRLRLSKIPSLISLSAQKYPNWRIRTPHNCFYPKSKASRRYCPSTP